ncbi:MAG: DNA mismatch repair endonuclease MutL [Bacteroidota bacterium]|nr:MAG: DNA mismatch repair endonuclease MutL [Bacteroidota bacterium]
MADIIRLLSDAVANQIAAGEVIQRPASVVKELVENAVDAGASEINVLVKEAGRSLIQVIDNGMGMSATDARMAFERHATSKIRSADDLFAIRTKGFRGEALASIASVAHVTLKTRLSDSELGTEIGLAASVVEKQETISCGQGSNFIVKNLFYNVPARRKFLKANPTEFKHILTEFQRIALSHPDIEFSLSHNDELIIHLPVTNLRQRIIHLFGKHMNTSLTHIENKTGLAHISGYIGKPEQARKTAGEQYFFINQRYMRHPYFHKAVSRAFENILPSDYYPCYFIFFEADPQTIDVNIHPTKTEIKFENEQALYQILNAAVKEALGKSSFVPSIDFDTYGVVDIPLVRPETEIRMPEIPVDYSFNPFNDQRKTFANQAQGQPVKGTNPVPERWQDLYQPSAENFQTAPMANLFSKHESSLPELKETHQYLQVKNRFILTPVKSGLMLIDQKRAHERILFEKFLRNMAHNKAVCQRLLYPEKINLNHEDYLLMLDILEELHAIGFELGDLGSNTLAVSGIPETAGSHSATELLEQLLEEYKQSQNKLSGNQKERIAVSLAQASAISTDRPLKLLEMQTLVDELFACENPNYSPGGKKTMSIVSLGELEKYLQ